VRTRGNISIEFVLGLVVVTMLGLGVLDLSAILLGVQFNDSLCTEASQMAAGGPPDQAAQRAGVVIARGQGLNNWFVSNITLAGSPLVSLTGPTVDTLRSTGGAVNGLVSVSTLVQVHLPVLGSMVGTYTPRFQTTRTSQFRYSYPTP
jgi:hypothetical protein